MQHMGDVPQQDSPDEWNKVSKRYQAFGREWPTWVPEMSIPCHVDATPKMYCPWQTPRARSNVWFPCLELKLKEARDSNVRISTAFMIPGSWGPTEYISRAKWYTGSLYAVLLLLKNYPIKQVWFFSNFLKKTLTFREDKWLSQAKKWQTQVLKSGMSDLKSHFYFCLIKPQ